MPLNRNNRNIRSRKVASSATSRRAPVQVKQPVASRSRRVRSAAIRRNKAVKRSAVKGAESKLKNFRQASILAVAITGFILMVLAPGETEVAAQDTTAAEAADTVSVVVDTALQDLVETEEDTAAYAESPSSKESADEAIGALSNLWNSLVFNLPKILIALGILVLAWLLTRLIRYVLHKSIGRWNSSSAITTLVLISVWLLAIGVAVSVVAGDIRALVGSFGLIGLALSWSLQTPIESFTGWLLNSFQGYYRVGDRIRVGEVFGDVYRIDFLTTTVWEIGAPYQPGFVQAEQPTGRLVTFPNNEIVTGTVINLTGDFPYVWDELSVAIANESDIELSMRVLENISLDLLGNYMAEPAKKYSKLLLKAGLEDYIKDKPQVFISMDDSWTNITIRYLVGARERRKWKSELTFRIAKELNKPDYLNKIIPVYPRQQVQFINPGGVPVDVESFRNPGEK